MAFVRLAHFAGGTREHYDALARLMTLAKPPAGRHVFAAGPTEDGWQVVQVWSSRSALEDFNREHFFPAMAALDADAFPTPPSVTDFETVDLALQP